MKTETRKMIKESRKRKMEHAALRGVLDEIIDYIYSHRIYEGEKQYIEYQALLGLLVGYREAIIHEKSLEGR
ncbi:MAG: hypothetical protein JXB14_02190 [Candidatus Altiarchaeota archaeon]|nr:hypothetical protein [Candidatus Altiarchaeota archaeon]